MSTKNENVEGVEEQLMASFAGGFETYEEAEARKQKEEAEQGGRPDINYFKMDKHADYDIKVFPHHPESKKDGAKGYSTAVRQAWLKIMKPGADKPINVKVFDARMAGFSEDLLSKFKYLAVGKLKGAINDASAKAKEKLEKTLDIVDSSGFNGGLRFDYKHLMWILDMANREKGIHMFECSNGVFKGLEETKMTIWSKRNSKKAGSPCPVTGIGKDGLSGANNVIIQKIKNGKKTDYKTMLDVEEGLIKFTPEEINALILAPKLPTFITYNKRSFQATIIFLQQYDAQHNLGVFSSEEFVEVVEKLKAEVDAVESDNSSFDLNQSSKSDSSDNDTDSEDGLKLDDLLDEFDELVADEFDDSSDEMKDFRKKLRKYLKQEGIPGIKIGKSDSTESVIQKIEDFVEENGERGIVAAEGKGGTSTPPEAESGSEGEQEEEEQEEEEQEEEEQEEEEQEERLTRRRRSSNSDSSNGTRTTRRRR